MRVAEGVYSIGQRKGGRVHAYLFEQDSELTLVDTLFDADAEPILDCIRSIGRTPGDLKHIALTHAHRSHLGGLARLKRLTGALVCAHEWEADIIAGERLAQPVSMRPQGPLSTYPMRIGLAIGRPRHAPCPVDRLVLDGDQVGPLQVVHIPGHTPGHIAFHWEQRGVLAVGDAVATWPRLDAGWPGFNLNEGQYRASLKRLAQIEAEVIAVGHGEPLTERASEHVHALAEGSS
ncbi:MAG TPA: MBL fold metallo-hydrolase [Solirubrobacterales bacterium]|nr:MBL fold metallo-hydrolase [Solirubrobacterales bacterium]